MVPASPGAPGNALLSKGGDNGESELEGNSGGTSAAQTPAPNESADGVPGRVQSRINVTSDGMAHIGLALASPLLLGSIDPNHDVLTTGQTAALGAFATLVGGLSAGLAGANAQAGAQAGQNVALNNDAPHWGLPTSQTQTGLLGQRTGSGDGLTAGNPLSDAAAVACAGGTQTCDTQLFQTLSQARGANADQALGTIGSAAPYVGGALGLTLGGVLFGPEILAGCAANPVLCVNQGAIRTGEIYVGFNGMPVGTGAPGRPASRRRPTTLLRRLQNWSALMAAWELLLHGCSLNRAFLIL